ncbi:MAG: rRNA-processing protein and EBNA1-binding protein ebp2 [Peltula sp. TS41687]|nr:MAG: rRNA-processing protein and EBNA1-binding protein ebp2 [Peltula sp. TS41687]
MAHKSKLKSALEAYQGRDQRVEHQKRLQKKAVKEKKKKKNEQGKRENEVGEDEEEQEGVDEDEDENEEDEDMLVGDPGIDISHIDDSESESELDDADNAAGDGEGDEFQGLASEPDERDVERDAPDDDDDENADEDADEEEEEEDIPLSELSSLSSTAKEDIIPHQRLQINNTSALSTSLKSIALPLSKLAFSEHQSITSTAPTDIADINDDLNRELAFYKQSLEAVQTARKLLKAEGMPFSRPADYFAEMVKSDEHMGRIKEKLVDEASRKKASAEARKLRDLKKFGKQVQVAKLQERDKAKRETLGRIQSLKRKRQQGDLPTTTHEEEGNDNENDNDPFSNVTVERDERQKNKRSKLKPSSNKSKLKTRDKRDAKFGFGGRKRHAKSGDAVSSGDLSGISESRAKARPGTGMKSKSGAAGKGKRLGKSRRMASR